MPTKLPTSWARRFDADLERLSALADMPFHVYPTVLRDDPVVESFDFVRRPVKTNHSHQFAVLYSGVQVDIIERLPTLTVGFHHFRADAFCRFRRLFEQI